MKIDKNIVARASGFSFTELLFAVMILGIGFILVAAIFPVGLAQTKSNFDETHAASLARAAVAELGQTSNKYYYDDTADNAATTNGNGMPDNRVYPLQATAPVVGVTTPTELTQLAERNMISPSDPRYAWVAMFRRPANSSNAQVMIVVVNRAEPFKQSDFTVTSNLKALEPRPIEFDIVNGVVTVEADVLKGADHASDHLAAAPGAFLIVADDALGANTDIPAVDRPFAAGRFNGRAYRLGASVGTDQFEMMPGFDFTGDSFKYDDDSNSATPDKTVSVPSYRNAKGFIIGRNRTGVGASFEGAAMDVAYYTGFISMK